jgi:bifunctional non-homologous end joining protein LigD
MPTRPATTRRATIRPAPPPGFVEPALATLVDRPPAGPGWLHEVKFDGYRLIVRIGDGEVRLLTRSGLDWTDRFASLAQALRRLPVKTALIDGEAVVMDAAGVSSFAALQQALSEGRHDRIQIYLFDLLHLDGDDLRRLPLTERKGRLKVLLERSRGLERVHYSEGFDAPGEEVYAQACRLQLEGVVSKRGDGPYRSGRARDWLKSKCKRGQELVIAGFIPSDKAGRAFRSLLLAVYDPAQKRFRYSGHVGTGFSTKVATELHARMDALRSDRPTLDDAPREDRRRAVWLKPELVAEIEFTERTADNELRHPSFKGLRLDKRAEEVRLETAQPGSRR